MKVVSIAQMRELDRQTISAGVPAATLMDRAGEGLARIVADLCQRRGQSGAAILLLAGRGNNGGDALAAARHLLALGHPVRVWLACSARQIKGAARVHLQKLLRAKIPLQEFPSVADWERLSATRVSDQHAAVVVDGLLGIGVQGPAEGTLTAAIRYLNALASHSLVVAIDVPSGLHGDTGRAAGEVVQADLTITMGLPKRGLLEPWALDKVGRLRVVDIGISQSLIAKIEAEWELIGAAEVRSSFKRRQSSLHKGALGHLLIMGGAAGYSGAISLAARAALRCGVGLVSAVVPRSIAGVVAAAAPEVMVHAAPETESGSLALASWALGQKLLQSASALLAGPGMTQHADTQALVRRMLHECRVPLLLDADALNVCAGDWDVLAGRQGPLVLTPHPGEMGRLLGSSSAQVQADRCAAARSAAARSGAVVVLKGAGTLVAAAHQPLWINCTGNPGLATAGAGDVLAGMLGGFLAQGQEPLIAARAAVFLHGLAGDLAADEQSESSLIAGDIIEFIPRAWRRLLPR